MEVLLGAIWVVLAGILLAVSVYALFVGLAGGLMKERFERCPRCGHHALSAGGLIHQGACPATLHDRAPHLLHGGFHPIHVRHH